MMPSFTNVVTQLMTVLPVLLAVMLLLACAGFGFFIFRLRQRDAWEEDDIAVVRRRDMTMLACIGVDLFVIAYVAVVFHLFQFLVDHIDLLR